MTLKEFKETMVRISEMMTDICRVRLGELALKSNTPDGLLEFCMFAEGSPWKLATGLPLVVYRRLVKNCQVMQAKHDGTSLGRMLDSRMPILKVMLKAREEVFRFKREVRGWSEDRLSREDWMDVESIYEDLLSYGVQDCPPLPDGQPLFPCQNDGCTERLPASMFLSYHPIDPETLEELPPIYICSGCHASMFGEGALNS